MRVARSLISVVYAIVLGGYYLYGQFAWDPPLGRDFWYGSGPGNWIVVAATFAVGFAIGRWYATGLALAPVFAAIPPQLEGMTGDFHDAYPPLEKPFLWVYMVPSVAVLLAVGVVLRKAVQRLVARSDGTAARPSS